LQYGWSFKETMLVIPDGILDKGIGLIIRNARSKRKAALPLPSYSAVATADKSQVTDSRQEGFQSRLLGDRVQKFADAMEQSGHALTLNPLDIQMVQRGASLVATLQHVAQERGSYWCSFSLILIFVPFDW
jgi:hypothetical protein